VFEWTNAKVNNIPGPATITYPGDGYADLWGLHYYDAGGEFRTEALRDAYYGSTYKGGPQGLGTWLRAAAAAGKRLAVPEGGLKRPAGAAGPAPGDDPLYVQKMFETFRTHAAQIAYENYFNCTDRYQHRVFPDSPFPKASASFTTTGIESRSPSLATTHGMASRCADSTRRAPCPWASRTTSCGTECRSTVQPNSSSRAAARCESTG